MLRYILMPMLLVAAAVAQVSRPGAVFTRVDPPPPPPSLTDGTMQIRVGLLMSVAGIELGPDATVATPYVDFHSSGTAGLDFDSRLIGSGGSGVVGAGDLTAVSRRFLVDGVFKAGRQTAGQGDPAAVASFIANSPRPDHGGPAGVLGYAPGLPAAGYPDIDSVTTYMENTGRPPFFVVDGATFEVAGATARVVMPAGRPLRPDQVGRLFVGLQIMTNHANPWTGWLESWDPAGHWVQLIGGFTHLGGTAAPGQDPNAELAADPVPGGAPVQVAFAPLTKVWAQNSNCFIGKDADGKPTGPFAPKKCAGYELGLMNGTGVEHTYLGDHDPSGGYSWGFDAVNLGDNQGSAAHIARGRWDAGFQSVIQGRFGFLAEGKGPGDGFVSIQTGGLPFALRPGNGAAAAVWSVAADGTMEAAQLVLPHLPPCAVEKRPGHVCRSGRVLEVN